MTTKLYIGNTIPSDFLAAVGMGAYSNARAVHKFGFDATVGSSHETIWPESIVYVYRTTASVMKVSSSDIDDDDEDTGARTVVIEGLDSAHDEISETVILNGQTAVNTVKSYLRVHRMRVITAGSTGSNEGIIYSGTGAITAGKPAVVHSHIPIGDNQTLQAIYTIPAGHTGYLFNYQCFSGIAKDVDARLCIRAENEVFQTKAILSFIDGEATHKFDAPLELTAKSDIEIQARAVAGGGSISANMLIILISD